VVVQDAINNIINIIEQTQFQCRMLTRDGIKELLIVTMKNVYLEYDEQIFLQIQGLPMAGT
jgi:hypothetical protein